MTTASAAITLFLLLDPLGNAPLFLSVLRELPPRQRRRAILRELGFALLVLLVFLLFGRVILNALNISPPALSVAGGVVLFIVALRMLFPGMRPAGGITGYDDRDPWFVPLAVPLIAGPSAMAWVMLLATQSPERMGHWVGAVVAAVLAAGFVLLGAEILQKYVSDRGLRIVERLMGMILVVIAVQMLMDGVGMFLQGLGAAP